MRLEKQIRLCRQKAISPDFFAANDTFKQARTTAVVDLVKRAHRRQHITQHPTIDRHIVGISRQPRERREIGIMCHGYQLVEQSRIKTSPSYHAAAERREVDPQYLSLCCVTS